MSYTQATPTVTRRLGLRPGTARSNEVHDAVRAFQAQIGLPVTGELDETTEAALAARAIGNPVPLWYPDDEVVRQRIGDPDAVRRMQSAAGLEPTGLVDEALARLIGD